MKSKAGIYVYFGLMLINLYYGVMFVQWLFAIVVGIIATTVLMIYFYLVRNQDEVLSRTWRSFDESWPDMAVWQRAVCSFLFPIVFMVIMFGVIADNNIDKRKEEKEIKERNNGNKRSNKEN